MCSSDLIAILTASYSGTRSAHLSQEPLTAEDRIHGAAQHLMEAVEGAPTPALIAATGYLAPERDQGLWYTTVISFSATLTR